MNILLATGIYPPEIGGPATQTRGFASACQSHGHQVRVITYGDEDQPTAVDGFSVYRVSRRGGPWRRYLRYAWQLWRISRECDGVYAQGPVSEGVPATLGAWFARKPIVIKAVGDYAWEMAQQRGETAHLDRFLQRRHAGMIRLYEWLERWTARRAQAVIVPSEYLRQVAMQWGVPAQRIHVVMNATEPLPATEGRQLERERLGVVDQTVILTAVRAVPWKKIDDLIAWWPALPPRYLLAVAGDGPSLAAWQAQAAQRGLQARVRFLGRVDRLTLARWYEAADAFVLPSGYEGYPNVVAEAASRGLPCLVSDQGGNPETQRHFGELIKILPYRQREAWLTAIRQIITRADRRPATAANWTHEQMVAAIERLLQTTFSSYAKARR